VDHAFALGASVSGGVALAGVFGFSVQLYGDFAGYSFIALGLARLLGVRLTLNFLAPYLSASPAAFWRRWHVTLMSWFRDYVYIPLGGNRRGQARLVQNVLVVFVLSGLWHGAAWTFVLWGVYHGAWVAAGVLWARATGGWALPRGVGVAGTYLLWVSSLLLFRSESLAQAGAMAAAIWGGVALGPGEFGAFVAPVVAFHGVVFAYQGWRRASARDAVFLDLPVPARRLAYAGLVAAIAAVGFQPRPYLYFQF
jgi:D-alanyl-lipoteichoic acid acyltransferase DltB (MBOAT superfamily)